MAAAIKHRRDTLVNWEYYNPIPLEGEMVLIIDATGSIMGAKMGNGTSTFLELPYFVSALKDEVTGKFYKLSVSNGNIVLTEQ